MSAGYPVPSLYVVLASEVEPTASIRFARLKLAPMLVSRSSIPVLRPTSTSQTESTLLALPQKLIRHIKRGLDTRHSHLSRSITLFIATTAEREVRLQPLEDAPPVETSRIRTTTPPTSCSSIRMVRQQARVNASEHPDPKTSVRRSNETLLSP